MTDSAAAPGRTTIERRAMQHTIAAVAARALRVPRRSVDVAIGDRSGMLTVRIAGRTRRPSRGGPSVLDVIGSTRKAVLDDGARLLGARFADVSVRITGIDIEEEGLR